MIDFLKLTGDKFPLTKYLVDQEYFSESPFVVLDVGARGGFEKHWNVLFEQVTLIGFEPDVKECRRLNKLEKSNTRKYYPLALFDSTGKRKFNLVVNLPQASSFYRFNTKLMSRFYDVVKFANQKRIFVNTSTLDSFIEREGIAIVDFLKLDVEGCEYDVLKRARKTLKNSILGLKVEVEFSHVFDNNKLFAEIDQFLRSMNFKLFDIQLHKFIRNPLSSDWGEKPYGQVLGGHAIYFRDAAWEIQQKHARKFWNDLRILKLAVLFEIFNLPDCSLELIQVAKNNEFLKGLNNQNISNLKSLLGKSISRLSAKNDLWSFK